MFMISEIYFFNVFDYNVFIFCYRLRNGILMKGGLFIEIYIGIFGLYFFYVVVFFVFKIVNNYF